MSFLEMCDGIFTLEIRGWLSSVIVDKTMHQLICTICTLGVYPYKADALVEVMDKL